MITMAREVKQLRMCLKGDPRAFEVIVSKYQELICAITFSGTADVQQSEELAHQTFINAWKNLSQLKDLSRFRPWLCTIARNNIRNFINKNQRDIIAKAKPMENLNDKATDESSPLESAIKKEHRALVSEAIQQIPEQYREPLVLYYRQQQSVKQVARSLDLSQEIIKKRLQRGRKMIKEQLSSIVEETLSATGPKKAFTTAVIASIAGMAIKGTGVAAATGVVAGTSTAGTVTGVVAIMSGITAKIITVAAVVAIGVGAAVTYKHVTKPPKQGPNFRQSEIVTVEPKERQSLDKDHYTKADNFSSDVVTSLETKTLSSENTDSASQEQGTNQSISSQTNEPETPKTGISGIVFNKSNSKPIKGAEVFYGSRRKPQVSSFTDANGHFEFLDMEPRNRHFFYIVAKGFTSRRITLDIIKDKVYENFKVELTPGSKVAGVVYDPNDRPVKGATVGTFQFTNHPVVTDANGFFKIDGLDPGWGQYSLHVEHPNYPAFSTSFSPANAGETTWQDVVLKPGVMVYGQVTDTNGNPIANVDIGNTTSRAMWNCISTKTDLEGKYELKNVDAGELILWAVINKYALYVERFSLNGSEAKKLINIQLKEPLPLQGKIVDQQGNPVSGASVAICEYKSVRNLVGHQDRVTSDSSGKFLIPNAPTEGMVKLSVVAEDISSIEPELEMGKEEYIITVDRAGKVYGKVVDEKTGEPINKFNVKLTFSTKGYQPGWGYSATWNREGHNFDSAEGFFDTGRENLPVGAEYSLTVYADGFDPLTINPVIVQPISSDPNRTEFRLKPATTIAGRVVDNNGLPIVGARIRWFSEGNKLTYNEHWDDRDTAVTNSKGEFVLSAIGSGKCGIYITRETFAPYLSTSLVFPEDANKLNEVVLFPGGEIFGKVTNDGKAVADASVSCGVFRQKLGGSDMGYINLRATTDIDGYYEIFDLPAGEISVSFSTKSGMFGSKRVKIEAGQIVELNFGDEAGFTISGVARVGADLLKNVRLTIAFPDTTSKTVATDDKGEFQLTGIPKGVYTLHASYDKQEGNFSGMSSPDRWLNDRREIDVKGDIELDIDFGNGSVSGSIPEQFLNGNELYLIARRLSENQFKSDIKPQKWDYAGRASISSEGSFTCSNLRAGKYYLLLSAKDGTLVTNVFDLAESEQLENIAFNLGRGMLQIHVVEADTLYGIPNAVFTIKNDLEAIFYSKEFVLEDKKSRMVTDDRGIVEYPNLPKGKYAVWVQTPGYLTKKSDWVNLSDGGTRKVIVPVERAAIVNFEIAEELKKRINADTVYLRCQVTNISTNELVPMVSAYGEDEEHTVWLLPEKYAAQRQNTINLPEGRYEIRYRLYQDRKGSLSYKLQSPLFEGTVNIALDKGETKTITMSKL